MHILRTAMLLLKTFTQFLEATWLFMQYGYSHVFTIVTDNPIAKWL